MSATEEDPLAQLSRMADELLTEAGLLRRGWEELAGVVLDGPSAPSSPASATEEAAAPTDDRLLIALDMALSGRTRDDAAEYLRKTFGPEGLDEILDEAFDRG